VARVVLQHSSPPGFQRGL